MHVALQRGALLDLFLLFFWWQNLAKDGLGRTKLPQKVSLPLVFPNMCLVLCV